MECAQLNITGGGSTQPSTVSFPGAYAGTDPGIKINIYQTLQNYTIPGERKIIACLCLSDSDDILGPAVFTC